MNMKVLRVIKVEIINKKFPGVEQSSVFESSVQPSFTGCGS